MSTPPSTSGNALLDYQVTQPEAPERCDRIAGRARQTFANHFNDARSEQETLAAMLADETRDETWNAWQRQFLVDGWMHNNLRMCWCKRLIASLVMTNGCLPLAATLIPDHR